LSPRADRLVELLESRDADRWIAAELIQELPAPERAAAMPRILAAINSHADLRSAAKPSRGVTPNGSLALTPSPTGSGRPGGAVMRARCCRC
jgi:hypothetical protein